MTFNYIHNYSGSNNRLQALNEMLTQAEVRISKWGKREIVVVQDGEEKSYCKGTYSLEKLVRRISGTAECLCRREDMTIEERVTGMEIVRQLRILYQTSDNALRKKGRFTKFINKIREFAIFSTTPRDSVEGDEIKVYFRAYRGKQFKKEFGNWITRGEGRNSDGMVVSLFFQQTIIASEEAIRGKFSAEKRL